MSEIINDEDEDLDVGENNVQPTYPDVKIKINKEQYSVFELKRKFEEKKEIIMDPDFQRNCVWETRQKIELIESLIIGLPLPPIYLFEQSDGKKIVVDGRQRLMSIFEYMNGNFSLDKVKILPKENGHKFKELPPISQGKIEDYQIQIYAILPPTPEQVKFDIFDRVNRGGTRLNNQEMRNALHLGKCTKLLNELSNSNDFQIATEKSIKNKRMKDQYIILRFLSFYMWKKEIFNNIDYKSDIDDFLAKSMDFINKLSDEKIEELKQIFCVSIKNCYEILGENCFRIEKQDGKKRPINMALFETLVYLLSEKHINTENKNLIKEKVNSLKEEFMKNEFSQNVDSSTKVKFRFDKIIALQEELKNV